MDPAITRLNEYLMELEKVTDFKSIEDKANHIGIINQLKNSIGLLELCEKNQISAGSLVNQLPETDDPNLNFVVAYQNESTNPENWEEVLFDGKPVWLSSGDLVVRR